MKQRTRTIVKSFVIGMLLGAVMLMFILTSEVSNEARRFQKVLETNK